ncbi:hypothetical protein A7U60_g8677 [Sanghuangporus baumii]|uniref:Uncharacterized protein n=1 Tax=Sanghuangporus baumii TaxID=108892 RepID=A0A9Q5HQC5_SANBA|nr:hypothetical protein A7U60_g8677 [Sanghuangporus baumii]
MSHIRASMDSVKGMPQETCSADFAGLYPITPAQSTRYSKPSGVYLSCKRIPPAYFSRQGEPEPPYSASGWSSHIQAEGQPYFYFKNAGFVTEANIYDAGKYQSIVHWMLVVHKLAEAQRIVITGTIEIMLQLDEDNENTCGYYLVDHDCATVFWLQEVTSEELGIPDSVSISQCRTQTSTFHAKAPADTRSNFIGLTSNELYWTHVEYFSAHLDGLRMSWARDLYSILTHARADHLTSLVGTFPYTADQCKEFQDLLRDHISGSSEMLSDKYIICVVARLWAQVARHRFLNFYGEQCARLSRDQRVVNSPPDNLPFLLRVFSRIALLDTPRRYAAELENLWIDNIVYAEPWKTFVTRSVDEWREMALWTTGLTSMHAVIYFASMGSSAISVAALALSISGFISSMALANYHRLPMNYETQEAADYLSRMCHSRFGFTPLSWMYSIPKALLFWSTGLMILQTAFALFDVIPMSNRYVAGSIAYLMVAVLFGVAYVLRLQRTLFSWIPVSFFPSSAHHDDLERNDD